MVPRIQQLEPKQAGRIRLALAALLAVILLIPVVSVYAAGSDNGAGPVPTNQRLCVVGSVIDHEEKPLADGRIVTATSGTNSLTAAVDASGNFRFEDGLVPGTWTFSIDVQKEGEEWEPVTPASFDVPIDYGRSECYKIRFKLRRLITVNVIKIDDNHNRLGGWRIRAEPGAGNVFAAAKEAVTDDAEGTAVFKLTKGLWIFTEYGPAGVNYTPVLPNNGRQELNVTAPGPHTLRFKNRLLPAGCIDAIKQDVPPEGSNDAAFPLPGWKIEVRRADGSVAASGVTNAAGTIRFSNLPFGPYTVVEETRVGWAPATSASFDVVLTPDDAQCVLVPFENKQVAPEYCIEGRKIDTNGKIGLPGWVITATPLDKGDEKPANQVTNGLGVYKFSFSANDYRVPGSRYKVCEVQQAGWLPHTSTCYTVTLPKEPGRCVWAPDFENQQLGHGRTTPVPSTGCRITHTVLKGQSLFGIGAHYGVSASAMVSANPWVRNNKNMYVYPGQQLCIP